MRKLLFAILLVVSTLLSAQVTITMEQEGGVYKVPCVVNGAKMKFIFDTGAATVCLSESMAEYLLVNDYITKDDILGTGTSQVADGRIVDHVKINLRDIEVAGLHLKDVEAVVVEGQRAPLLLGQTAIQKLGKVSIEGNKLTIDNGRNDDVDFAIQCLWKKCQYHGGMSDNITLDKFIELLNDNEQLKSYFDFTRENYPSLFEMSWKDFINEINNLQLYGECKLVSKDDIWNEKWISLRDKAQKFEEQRQFVLAAETWEEYYNLVWDGSKKDSYSTSEGYTYSHQGEDALNVGGNYYGAKNYQKAIPWLNISAEKGNRQAQYLLGYMYAQGIGFAQNYTTAVYWLKKAAENDHAGAQCYLGYCYVNGYGVKEDIGEGFYWTRQAYKNGDKTAEENLSYYFTKFKSLAESGNVAAAFCVGLCYYEGFGTNKNPKEAIRWFTFSAERGDADAMYFLAGMYFEGLGTNIDRINAAYWYKKSANLGNISAQYSIARCYQEGFGVKQDYLSAYNWFSRAAEQGDVASLCELGKMLLYGQGVKKDFTKAKEYLDRAAKNEYEEAYYILGNMYWQGFGVEQNYKTAVDWWYKCSRSYEDKRGIDYLIAIAWRDGKGRKKDSNFYQMWMLNCANDVNGLNELAYDFAIGQNGWKKQLSQALIVIEEAIKLKPQDPNYYDSKGEFYSMQNNYEKAKEMWNKVKSIDASFYTKNNTELNKYILKNQTK